MPTTNQETDPMPATDQVLEAMDVKPEPVLKMEPEPNTMSIPKLEPAAMPVSESEPIDQYILRPEPTSWSLPEPEVEEWFIGLKVTEPRPLCWFRPASWFCQLQCANQLLSTSFPTGFIQLTGSTSSLDLALGSPAPTLAFWVNAIH